jgi:hypothetical protein
MRLLPTPSWRSDDDLPRGGPLDDLYSALRAPGRPNELRHAPQVMERFRSSRTGRKSPSRPRRRIRSAFTIPAVIATICISGAGAGYASALPPAVQHAVHRVLGPLGVPGAHHGHHTHASGAGQH